MERNLRAAIEAMKNHGFEVLEMDEGAQAKAYLLDAIPAGSNVGIGGSVSIREIEIMPALAAKGCAVLSTWGAKKEEVMEIREASRTADVFLTSANALTKTGSLVFVDGNCNRVGAILDGPKTVYFVVSHSKWVDGGINTAVARIKQTACPLNARRLGLDTPCAQTGLCKPADCDESCMCSATVALERVPRGRKMVVLLVREALGY